MSSNPTLPTPPGSFSPLSVRTPLPLTPRQNEQVQEIYRKRVRAKCADEIKEFAMCATYNTYTVTWTCKSLQRVMNSCLAKYATLDEQDRAREEWFATIDSRRREKEEREQKKKAALEFHREWWGMDEHGRRKLEKTKPEEQGRMLAEKIIKTTEGKGDR